MIESKWYGGKHCYNDAEQQHVFIYLANPTSTSLYFNTNLVNPKDFKSYWDLVNPKWKGKYVSQEPTSTGIGPSLQFFFYHPDLGPDFLRKLFIDQQPVYGRDRRQITDWLAQGKFALCLGCRDSDRAKQAGSARGRYGHGRLEGRFADLSRRRFDRVSSRAGRIPTPPRFLSTGSCRAAGQIALQKYDDLYGQEPPNSRRIDIPKDMLPPSSRLVEGRRYFDFTDPKYADMTPIYQFAKEFMKGREEK